MQKRQNARRKSATTLNALCIVKATTLTCQCARHQNVWIALYLGLVNDRERHILSLGSVHMELCAKTSLAQHQKPCPAGVCEATSCLTNLTARTSSFHTHQGLTWNRFHLSVWLKVALEVHPSVKETDSCCNRVSLCQGFVSFCCDSRACETTCRHKRGSEDQTACRGCKTSDGMTCV